MAIVDTRRHLREEDSKWSVKALLRLVTAFFAALAVVLFATAISLTNQNFVNVSGNGDWSDGLALAPAVLAFLYNSLTLVLIPLRKGALLHPLLHVLGDFVVWALCVPAIIFASTGGLFWYWTQPVANADGIVDCGFFFNAWAEVCTPVAYTIGRIEIAGLILLFCIFIAEVALFSIACMDAYRWRKEKKMGDHIEKSSFELQYSKDMEQGSL